jgi:putative PIN family toxin of toxin-antitoxin system
VKPIQIVVDTNVLLSGLRSRLGASYKLLSLLNDPRWQLNISIALIFEYEAVLKREKQQLNLTDSDIDTLLNGICAIASKHQPYFLWRPSARDPNDDFLIDLAVKCQADYIITYNQKDLVEASKFSIKVITPKQFLLQQGEIQ